MVEEETSSLSHDNESLRALAQEEMVDPFLNGLSDRQEVLLCIQCSQISLFLKK